MRARRPPVLIAVACVVAAGFSIRTAAAQDTSATLPGENIIVVGSKAFPENRLLGEILAQLIEARTDLRVERRVGLGGTAIAFRALLDGEIDLYPEYTGTGWSVQLRRREKAGDPLQVYAHVSAEFRRRFKIVWMQPFGFSNSYALAMEASVADRLGVKTISDLLAHQDELRAGVSHEFLNRPDGFPGLAEAYGLEIGDVRGMEHGLSYQAIASGRVDLIDTYTTDGMLARTNLRLLEDDRGFFPPYEAAAIVREATLRAHPELDSLLDKLAFRIDDDTMRSLNYRVEVEGGAFSDVARDYLESEGLLETKGEPQARRRPGQAARIANRVFQHVALTLTAVLLAVLVAIPTGIVLARRRRLAGPVLGIVGVIQTIPSLALLAFMIPLPGLGLGARSAIAALFLYALLPIVRNTYTGIREVDPDLIEAATGMGLTDVERLWKIELPLATRTIMAGIRTSTVISIGVATLAAFIGAGGLGEPILTGLQLNDISLVLSGAIPAALLAIVADFSLGRLERLLSK